MIQSKMIQIKQKQPRMKLKEIKHKIIIKQKLKQMKQK